MKEKLKTESHYSITLKVSGEFESLKVIQEENVMGRKAIRVSFFEERWRTPKEVLELLEKIKIVITNNFL